MVPELENYFWVVTVDAKATHHENHTLIDLTSLIIHYTRSKIPPWWCKQDTSISTESLFQIIITQATIPVQIFVQPVKETKICKAWSILNPNRQTHAALGNDIVYAIIRRHKTCYIFIFSYCLLLLGWKVRIWVQDWATSSSINIEAVFKLSKPTTLNCIGPELCDYFADELGSCHGRSNVLFCFFIQVTTFPYI